MRILLNRFINNNSKLPNSKGQSYLEFSVMIIFVITIFYTVFEVFWLINAQILLTNTTKSTLREVEVYGQVKPNLIHNVEESLKKAKNLNSVSILINDEPAASGTKYQLRDPIKITIKANYNITILNDAYKETAAGRYTGIPLSATYHGISQRLDKDDPDPVIITE